MQLAVDVDVVAAVQLVPGEQPDAAAGRPVVAKVDRGFPDRPQPGARHGPALRVEDLEDRVERRAQAFGRHLNHQRLALAGLDAEQIGVGRCRRD